MKKDSFWNKIQILTNLIVSILLLLSYVLPYISPKLSPIFTIISLAVPILFILNLFFIIYWIIKLKKYVFISSITILLGTGYINSIYKFSEKKIFLNTDVKIMSYNVRLFNAVGASGAVYGVLVAFGMYFKDAKLALIFFPVPIAAKYFIPLILLGDLFFGMTKYSIGNVAHFAHIGGALIGFLLAYYWKQNQFKYYK